MPSELLDGLPAISRWKYSEACRLMKPETRREPISFCCPKSMSSTMFEPMTDILKCLPVGHNLDTNLDALQESTLHEAYRMVNGVHPGPNRRVLSGSADRSPTPEEHAYEVTVDQKAIVLHQDWLNYIVISSITDKPSIAVILRCLQSRPKYAGKIPDWHGRLDGQFARQTFQAGHW